MNQPLPPILIVLAAILVWLCLTVWILAALQWLRGRAVLPYQPRRLVPWRGIDLAALTAFYLTISLAFSLLAPFVLDPQAAREPTTYKVDQTSSQHVIAKLFAEGDPWLLWLCGLSAVVVAPIAEELLIRLALQGWLERVERRLRPRLPTLRRLVPVGLVPILLSSMLFAVMHFRVAGPARHIDYYTYMLIGTAVMGLLMTALVIVWLRCRASATSVDLGWVREKLLADVCMGLVAFAAVAVPIYWLQLDLQKRLPAGIAPDPIPLFVFALVLGTLYYRTHRIVPAIVLHMALNGTTMAMVLMARIDGGG